MAEIRNYSNNPDPQTADRWPEGMAMSSVNDTGRVDEGIIGRWEKDVNGSLVSTGTASAYTLTPNRDIVTGEATPLYDGLVLAFKPHVANTASATLNVQATGALPLVDSVNVAISANTFTVDVPFQVVYSTTYNAWIVSGFGDSVTPANRSKSRSLSTQATLAQGRWDIKDPDHNVTGDGATDDLPDTQALVTDAAALGEDINVAPTANSYRLDGQLTLNANVGLQGQGIKSHLNFVNVSSGGEIEVSGNNRLDSLRLTSAGSQIVFGAINATDVRLTRSFLEGTTAQPPAILVQLNASGLGRWWASENYYNEPGNAFTINENAVGGGAFFLANYVAKAQTNAVTVNQPQGRKYSDVIYALNAIGMDSSVGTGTQGFAFAVAAGHRVVVGLNSVYETRQEAVHVEDATEGLVVLGNILDECIDDGTKMQNRPFPTFDANADVDTTANTITITNHKLTKDQPVQYVVSGTAIGGLNTLQRYYVIVVDDSTIQLAASPGGTAIDFTSKPGASETHTLRAWVRGYISVGNWARQKDEDRTGTAFNQVGDANRSIEEHIQIAQYARGFATAFRYGNTRGTVGLGGVAANCTNGVRVQEANSWLCDIGHYVVRDSAVGVVNGAGGGGMIGRMTFENVNNLFQAGAAAGNGLFCREHAGKVVFNHGGTGDESVTLFPIGGNAGNSRISCRLTTWSRKQGASNPVTMLVADLLWDGTTLTETNKTTRSVGGFTTIGYTRSGTDLQLTLGFATATDFDVVWNLDGMHYMED